MIRAVTFDLWDTMISDDSDETERAAKGMRSKMAERRHLLWAALDSVAPIDKQRVDLAYDVADAAFDRVWHHQQVTWPIADRLQVVLKGLRRALSEPAFARLVAAHETMEPEIAPNAIEGIGAALADLSTRYKLCVVSDAIVTPGVGLRALLAGHGLHDYFSGFVFSDEVGRSKPHRAMFDSAAAQLGVELEEMLHIGDRDHTDIKGAQALGLKAILFTGARDADRAVTSADALCDHLRDLPAIVDRLAGD